MIFMSFDYVTFCQWLIVTLALSLTVSEVQPLTAWNIWLKIAAKSLQYRDRVTIDSLKEVASVLFDGTIADLLWLTV